MSTSINKIATPHGLAAKIIHWTFIGVFIYAISKGLDSVEQLEDLALLRFEVAFALFFFFLLVARYVFMRMTKPTALTNEAPKIMHRMSRIAHLGIYISLGSIALSGLLIAGLFSLNIKDGFAMDGVIALHELAVSCELMMQSY